MDFNKGIFALGDLVLNSSYAGTFIFGFIERTLIPFGLHHIIYIPFWQTGLGGSAVIDGVTVFGAQNIFFAELASPNTTVFSVEACRFLTGKYSIMMAGLPKYNLKTPGREDEDQNIKLYTRADYNKKLDNNFSRIY